jgi:arylsulfatase A-like enzyme
MGRAARISSLALLAVLSACGAATEGRPNVLLVTIDTLRADRVGCYGYERDTTPNLDRLAAEGVRFANAYSHAPFTAPSQASLLTSLHTPSHGVFAWAEELDPSIPTLGQRFSSAGWRTAAFYNHPGLATSGVTRGFEDVHQFAFEDADTTLDAAFEWLDAARGRPFAVWLHLWDVHRPYGWRDWRPDWLRGRVRTRAEYTLSYGEERFGEPWTRAVGRDEGFYNLSAERRARELEVAGETRRLGPRDFQYLSDRYDGGVFWADRALGRLFGGLRRRGLYDETLIVVTSDHGESLTEREACYFAHDPFLYEETLRVPLVARFPGGRHAGATVEALARGVDVLPTLLEVAGIEPMGNEQGRSLVGRVEGTDRAEYLLYAQTQTRNAKERTARAEGGAWLEHRVAVSDGRHKLIHDLDRDAFAYFDLERDPGEREDRSGDPAAAPEIERLRAAYEELRRSLPRSGDTAREVDPATLEMLGRIGYGDG